MTSENSGYAIIAVSNSHLLFTTVQTMLDGRRLYVVHTFGLIQIYISKIKLQLAAARTMPIYLVISVSLDFFVAWSTIFFYFFVYARPDRPSYMSSRISLHLYTVRRQLIYFRAEIKLSLLVAAWPVGRTDGRPSEVDLGLARA